MAVGAIGLLWGVAASLVMVLASFLDGKRSAGGKGLTILSITNVVHDAIMLCLPMQQSYGLQMAKIRKVQIGGIFLSGAL